MKFCKSLSSHIVETLPEWRDKFLSYKKLKKRLKLIADAGAVERQSKRQRVGTEGVGDGGSPPPITPEEAGFVCLLEAELEKFNAFFLGKEEDCVIRQKELQDRVLRASEMGSAEELMRVGKEIVDFHGEMVLLVNYSALNYTGLVKILKKYDKRTGALIRLPFIQRVLQQPFFTTDLLHKLVKECEAMLDQIIPAGEPFVPNEHGNEESDSDEELDEIEGTRSMYMRSTVATLRTLKEIRGGPRR